tara:strand:- start:742 stop:849 length:108 start_codon:yes stop_codon:yes gene_type:complete
MKMAPSSWTKVRRVVIEEELGELTDSVIFLGRLET